LIRYSEEIVAAPVKKAENTAVGIHCSDYATLYPQNLALTLPISGGRSVGIVHRQTNAMEFSIFLSVLKMDDICPAGFSTFL
jgi:hypothetical protein